MASVEYVPLSSGLRIGELVTISCSDLVALIVDVNCNTDEAIVVVYAEDRLQEKRCQQHTLDRLGVRVGDLARIKQEFVVVSNSSYVYKDDVGYLKELKRCDVETFTTAAFEAMTATEVTEAALAWGLRLPLCSQDSAQLSLEKKALQIKAYSSQHVAFLLQRFCSRLFRSHGENSVDSIPFLMRVLQLHRGIPCYRAPTTDVANTCRERTPLEGDRVRAIKGNMSKSLCGRSATWELERDEIAIVVNVCSSDEFRLINSAEIISDKLSTRDFQYVAAQVCMLPSGARIEKVIATQGGNLRKLAICIGFWYVAEFVIGVPFCFFAALSERHALCYFYEGALVFLGAAFQWEVIEVVAHPCSKLHYDMWLKKRNEVTRTIMGLNVERLGVRRCVFEISTDCMNAASIVQVAAFAGQVHSRHSEKHAGLSAILIAGLISISITHLVLVVIGVWRSNPVTVADSTNLTYIGKALGDARRDICTFFRFLLLLVGKTFLLAVQINLLRAVWDEEHDHFTGMLAVGLSLYALLPAMQASVEVLRDENFFLYYMRQIRVAGEQLDSWRDARKRYIFMACLIAAFWIYWLVLILQFGEIHMCDGHAFSISIWNWRAGCVFE